jgi:hypothetical protein
MSLDTYPSVLARHFLPGGAWLMRNLHLPVPVTAASIFDDLEGAGLLFNPRSPHGVLPINFNTTADALVAKGQFLILGPDHACLRTCMDQLLTNKNLRFTRD